MTTGRLLATRAAVVVVVIWGGILALAEIERRLPTEQMWLGHAAVHAWTAIFAGFTSMSMVRAVRSGRVPAGPLSLLMRIVIGAAAATSITAALDAGGAHPTARSFHDSINVIAEPVAWLLLVALLSIVLVGAMSPPSEPGDGRAS